MKKCLLYTSCLQRGGTERIVTVYSRYFIAKGCDPIVLTNFRLSEEYPLSEGVMRVALQDTIDGNKFRIWNYVRRIMAIRKVCKQEKVEVAVAFAKANAVRLLLATLGLNTKVVISIRVAPEAEFKPGIRSYLVKKFFNIADGFLFQTKEQRDFFGKKIAGKSIVIMNSIDSSFQQEVMDAKRDNRIVTVGRLIERKNQKMLMNAFYQIADEYPKLELVIYGKGEYRKQLLDEIERLGMHGRIKLPGEVENVAEAIGSARIFVLPSDYEGMPNALLEAMALGIPVIATDCPCGGPAEIIQDGVNGYLIPVGDTGKLTETLRKLLADENKQKQFGKAGMKIRQECSEEATFEKFYVYLEKVLHG